VAVLAPGAVHGVVQTDCNAPPGPASYQWPVKPFDRPHPVRGNFGDPRTIFRGNGTFSFHNGVDIVAAPWTPVYPVTSGRAPHAGANEIIVGTGATRRFQYWHLLRLVVPGDRVVKGRTILGLVQPLRGHVHL